MQMRKGSAARARFELCRMSRCQLVECQLQAARFEHADLRFARIEYCVLGDASFRDADLELSSLFGSSETAAHFSGANLKNVVRDDPSRARAESFVPMRLGPNAGSGT
ncbi:MAG: pentapeptide repeat-containing protein [Myxococcales bacterium]|nr:pentapeptide repeat-containing protein [Myxococcales bacterium]